MAVTRVELLTTTGEYSAKVVDTLGLEVVWDKGGRDYVDVPPGTEVLDIKFNGVSDTLATKLEVIVDDVDTGKDWRYERFGQTQDRWPANAGPIMVFGQHKYGAHLMRRLVLKPRAD